MATWPGCEALPAQFHACHGAVQEDAVLVDQAVQLIRRSATPGTNIS